MNGFRREVSFRVAFATVIQPVVDAVQMQPVVQSHCYADEPTVEKERSYMIINHKYKFIFLKTRKTAGTSIEIALSKFCDANDVITPISKEDELIRKELGFLGPQNFDVPLRFYSKMDWLRRIGRVNRKQFYSHAEAQLIRKCIDDKIWNTYFKFCFERDPFDKAISRYYWSTRDPRPEISEYLNSASIKLFSNWNNYTINDQIAVDFVGRYEKLADELGMIKEKLGLPGELSLPRAKGSYRKSRKHYSSLLDSESRARIEIVCAKEMAAFDYRWNESQD